MGAKASKSSEGGPGDVHLDIMEAGEGGEDRNGKVKQPESGNQYTTKKTVTSGLLNLSLLSANASQIKTVVTHGHLEEKFFYFLMVLLVLSVCLQVTTSVLFMLQGQGNVDDVSRDGLKKRRRLTVYGNLSALLAMLTAVVNVFITTFMDEAEKKGAT